MPTLLESQVHDWNFNVVSIFTSARTDQAPLHYIDNSQLTTLNDMSGRKGEEWLDEYLTKFWRGQITTFVKDLIDADIRLSWLQISYHSTFRGELSDILNSPSKATSSESDMTLVKPSESDPFIIERRPDGTVWRLDYVGHRGIPFNPRFPLDPFVHLRGRVQDIQIEGDVHELYMLLLMHYVLDDSSGQVSDQVRKQVEKNLDMERAKRVKCETHEGVNRALEGHGFSPMKPFRFAPSAVQWLLQADPISIMAARTLFLPM